MAFKNITITEQAYHLLAGLKQPGDSFSKVIQRHVHRPADTAGELLEAFEDYTPPPVDEKAWKAFRDGRGRRSNRK